MLVLRLDSSAMAFSKKGDTNIFLSFTIMLDDITIATTCRKAAGEISVFGLAICTNRVGSGVGSGSGIQSDFNKLFFFHFEEKKS